MSVRSDFKYVVELMYQQFVNTVVTVLVCVFKTFFE